MFVFELDVWLFILVINENFKFWFDEDVVDFDGLDILCIFLLSCAVFIDRDILEWFIMVLRIVLVSRLEFVLFL